MFWDSSALVPVLLPEAHSREISASLHADPAVTVWWATPVECCSALQRRHRERPLSGTTLDAALRRLDLIAQHADTVAATLEVRERAKSLLATHPLRSGDALQLAAALQWCEGQARGEGFACLDDRLREAARREGFTLHP